MKIYLDYVFFINFLFDFILLLGISIVLKRSITKTRLILASLFGGLSGFIIILNISSLCFFILKLLLGLIIVITCFSYKNIRYTMNNFIYLIILSIILGGSLYLLNIEISKTLLGNTIINNKLYIVLLIITGLGTILFYSKHINKTKKYINNKYKVSFINHKQTLYLIGYLDTGNNLTYRKRPVLILNNSIKIDLHNKKIIYIPFATINGTSVMKAFLVKEIFIDNQIYKNIYIGISNDKFHLKDSDIILNINLWEEIDERNTKKNTEEVKC